MTTAAQRIAIWHRGWQLDKARALKRRARELIALGKPGKRMSGSQASLYHEGRKMRQDAADIEFILKKHTGDVSNFVATYRRHRAPNR